MVKRGQAPKQDSGKRVKHTVSNKDPSPAVNVAIASDADVAELTQDVLTTCGHNVRAATSASYNSSARRYDDFCTKSDPPFEPTDYVLSPVRFLLFLIKNYDELKDLKKKAVRTMEEAERMKLLEANDIKLSTFKQLHAALQQRFNDHQVLRREAEVKKLQDSELYNRAYRGLLQRLNGGGDKSRQVCYPGEWINKGKSQARLTLADVKRILQDTDVVLTGDDARARALIMLMWTNGARGDSIRQCLLQSLAVKVFERVGPCRCVMFMVSYKNGKTTEAGLVDYLAIIRHRSLTLCPVFALATYLFHRFTIKGEELFLHEPLHLRFTTVPLIAGGKIGQALSYSGMNNVYKKLYAEYGLELGATTHATRKGGSAEMSTLGLELDIIKKHCGWSKDVADKHYLTEPRIEPALAMCDWPYQQDKWDEAFHALRFDIPLEYAWLVGVAAPHLFPMFTSLEQISMDGGREDCDSRAIFKKLFETFMEFVRLLCQDSIWMLVNNSEKFSSHIVCQHMMSCPGYVEILERTHSLWQSGQLAARQPVGVKEMLRAMDRRQQLEQQQQREWQQQWQPSAPP
ncbi:hypothetical protein QJQ45_026306 [Haematococcus lacustris]|nr:hypothetical protein QJQ45_026306 [Haematococcus lacustris]